MVRKYKSVQTQKSVPIFLEKGRLLHQQTFMQMKLRLGNLTQQMELSKKLSKIPLKEINSLNQVIVIFLENLIHLLILNHQVQKKWSPSSLEQPSKKVSKPSLNFSIKLQKSSYQLTQIDFQSMRVLSSEKVGMRSAGLTQSQVNLCSNERDRLNILYI